jgi:predicted kinase
MNKIILCRGIQGSGKTYWAKQWVLEDPEHRVRFNNDDIRNMLGKYWVPSREKLISCMKNYFLSVAIASNYDIVIDNMNLNEKEYQFYADYVEDLIMAGFKYTLECKDFHTDLDICIERDKLRENPIGEQVIKDTFEKYKLFYESIRV